MKNTYTIETDTHTFRLINYGEEFSDKWKGIMVINKDTGAKDPTYTNFEKVPMKVVSRKLKPKIQLIFKKYADSKGFINRKDINNLESELKSILNVNESKDIVNKIGNFLGEIKHFNKSIISENLSLNDMNKLKDFILYGKKNGMIMIDNESIQAMKTNKGTQFVYNKENDILTKSLIDIADDLGMPFDYKEIQERAIFII